MRWSLKVAVDNARVRKLQLDEEASRYSSIPQALPAAPHPFLILLTSLCQARCAAAGAGGAAERRSCKKIK